MLLVLKLELNGAQARLSRSSQFIGASWQNNYLIKHVWGIVYTDTIVVYGEEGIIQGEIKWRVSEENGAKLPGFEFCLHH